MGRTSEAPIVSEKVYAFNMAMETNANSTTPLIPISSPLPILDSANRKRTSDYLAGSDRSGAAVLSAACMHSYERIRIDLEHSYGC